MFLLINTHNRRLFISNKMSNFALVMNGTYNIYCDESCHLEHDRQKAMVLGGIWCPYDNRKRFPES